MRERALPIASSSSWADEFVEEKKEREKEKERRERALSDEEQRMREEEAIWFAQFLPHNTQRKSATATGWINEFTSSSSSTSLHQNWDAEFQRESLANQERREHDELRRVTERVTSIDDPKLQNSNFMRFIEGVRDGRVTLASNPP